MKFRVIVPATTANLGPGFDALGLALELHNELEVEVLGGGGQHDIRAQGEGADQLPTDERHLLIQTARWYCNQHDMRLPRLRLRQLNRIPLARGLGSSAAVIVAGLMLAARIRGQGGDDLVGLATQREGHPDNVAPAILGGLVASAMQERQVAACPMPLHDCWQIAVAIPAFKLATSDARKALPAQVPYGDAVFNLSRVAVLLGALREGRGDWVSLASQDRLHQPYRARLVPGLEAAMQAACERGATAGFLSGAGPTVAAWVDRRTADPRAVAEAMVEAFSRAGIQARGLPLAVSAQGAHCAEA